MDIWPVVTLIGFLVLTSLVVVLGMRSTSRYEAEKRGQATARGRHAAHEQLTQVAVS